MDMVEFQREAHKAKFVDEIRAVWQNNAFLPHRTRDAKLAGLGEVQRELLRQREATLPYGKRLRKRIRRMADQVSLVANALKARRGEQGNRVDETDVRISRGPDSIHRRDVAVRYDMSWLDIPRKYLRPLTARRRAPTVRD